MSDYFEPDFDPERFQSVQRLSRDLRTAARNLGDHEVRFLVDAYYMIQDDRKRAESQLKALSDAGEPSTILEWLKAQSKTLESQLKGSLDRYTQSHLMGSWMRQIYGIGPVISAGMLANIYMGMWCAECKGRSEKDCERRQKAEGVFKHIKPHRWRPVESCPTVGHIYQFAGIAGDDQNPWEEGQPRPYSEGFKTLCWKAGQSFMKFSNEPECFYGHLYRDRKRREQRQNERGRHREYALERANHVGKSTVAYSYYTKGLLPPAQVDGRARRWTVKIFLSHLHEIWYEREFGKAPPNPFAFGILKHHESQYIAPPHR